MVQFLNLSVLHFLYPHKLFIPLLEQVPHRLHFLVALSAYVSQGGHQRIGPLVVLCYLDLLVGH